MKLRHLKIQNFKGIREFETDFTDDLGRIRDLTLIVGPNGSGKTSILDAIWFGLWGELGYRKLRKSFREEPEYVVTTGQNYAQIDYHMEISKKELDLMRKWKKELIELEAVKPPLGLRSNTIEFTWTYPAQPGSRKVKEHYSGYGGYDWSQSTYGWEVLQGRRYGSQLQQLTAQHILERENMGGLHFFEQERQIIAKPVFKYQPVPDGDLFEDDGNSKDGPPDDLRLLLIDFGLKDKIRSSSDDEKSWYQIIRDSYNYICAPHEMGEVYALSSGSEYEIEFQDSDGLNYGFDGLSSGERSVLNFMVQYVYKRMRSSIVLIDELEQHLHPTWQRRLMQNLLRLNDGNQFIVTTHSPAIQQAAPSDSIIELGKLSEQIPDWQLAEAGE